MHLHADWTTLESLSQGGSLESSVTSPRVVVSGTKKMYYSIEGQSLGYFYHCFIL